MAGVALRVRLHVRRRLAGRDGTVMARRTATNGRRVMDHALGWRPSTRGMAGIATRLRQYVPKRLPRRLQGIVTSRALAEHIGRVFHDRARKRVLVMTIQALLVRGSCGNMRGRLECRCPCTALYMAGVAVLWHAARRQSRAMASGARHFHVRTLQYKTGGTVIEIRRHLCHRGRREQQRQDTKRQACDCRADQA